MRALLNAYAKERGNTKMPAKNIKYQFLHAINNSFKENQDKHSLKKQHLTGKETIFSYSARKDLVDLSSSFSNWLKKAHPEIRQVKEITSSEISGFLNHKATVCSQKTLEHYKSLFHKLSFLVNAVYHCKTSYIKDVVTPASCKNGGSKIRNQMLETSDYHTLLKTTNTNFKKALLLSQSFGLRASEISKLKKTDISDNQIRIIDSKGKRSRVVPIQSAEQKQALSAVLASTDTERICPVQHESLQQAFRRELKRNELDKKYQNGCFHLCRKAYATSQYKQARTSGLSVKESMSYVSGLLGHGANRFELMKEYICCALV